MKTNIPSDSTITSSSKKKADQKSSSKLIKLAKLNKDISKKEPLDRPRLIREASKIVLPYEKDNPSHFDHLNECISKYNLSIDHQLALKCFIKDFHEFEIVNGVGPVNILRPINLERVIKVCEKQGLPYQKYPKFSGVPIKFVNEDKSTFTAIYFKTGRINIVGLKKGTPEGLENNIKTMSKYESDFFGETQVFKNAIKRIANRVYSLKLSPLLEIKDISLLCELPGWKNIKYHSESFPGAVIQFDEYNVKTLFFKTGSLIIAGISSVSMITKICNELITLLCEYLALQNLYFLDNPTD